MRKKRKGKNNKVAKVVIILILLSVILIGGFVGYAYKSVQNYKNAILPGVKINDIDVSGKTFKQAEDLIKQKYYDPIQKSNINIKYIGKIYTIKHSQLNAKYNIKETVNSAIKYGKNLNSIQQYKLIRNPKIKNFKLSFTYDKKPITDAVKSIENQVNKQPVNASIKKTGAISFNVTPSKLGRKLDNNKLIEDLNQKIQQSSTQSFTIEAPIKDLVPKITEEKLKSINTLISSYTTTFSSGYFAKVVNIQLSTKAIDGTLVMPGEVFSFNETVGMRTAEKGYKAARVIIGNRVEDGLGGGVCQTSSTLYNTALKAGLYSVERFHHTFPSSYVPYGQDATVSYGAVDYKFKNNFKYPIYIQGFSTNGSVGFKMYSNSSLKNRSYTLRNEIYDRISPQTIYKDDSTLPKGTTEVEQKAYTGYKVKLYRDILENGKLIKTELISDDYYKKFDSIIRRGTKQ